MLPKTRKKMGIALIFFIAAAMLIRLAFATISKEVSVWLIGLGILSMLAALYVFGRYFRE